MPRHVTRWSKEEIKSVEDMWMAGKSAGLIALETRRSRSSIMGLVGRFDWKREEGIKIQRTNSRKPRVRTSQKRSQGAPLRIATHGDGVYVEPWSEYSARRRRERQEARDAAK